MTRANGGQESLSHKPSQFSTGVTPLNHENCSGFTIFPGGEGDNDGSHGDKDLS